MPHLRREGKNDVAEQEKRRADTRAMSVVSDAFAAFLLSVYLLAVPPEGYSNMTAFKYALFMAACGLYAALMLFFAVRGVLRGGRVGISAHPLTAADFARLALCAFLLFSAASAALSQYGGTLIGVFRREGLLTVAAYVVTCLLVSRHARPAPWMLWLSGISATLFCALSLAQFSGVDPLGLYPAGTAWASGGGLTSIAFFGTVGNADLSVAVLCAAAGAFLAAVLRSKRAARFLLLIPLALSVTVILMSGVEAGKAALLIGTLLLLPAAAGKNRRLRRAAAICVPAVIILGLLVLCFCRFDGPGTLYEASELLHGRWDDSFGSSRLYIWRSCWELFPEKPLFGGGPDTLGLRGIDPFIRWDPARGMVKRAIDAAHNEYLNILVNQGVFALISYLSALIAAAAAWYRAPENTASVVAGAGVLFYCVQAFFGISMCFSAPYMWLSLGLLLRAQTPGCDACPRAKTE